LQRTASCCILRCATCSSFLVLSFTSFDAIFAVLFAPLSRMHTDMCCGTGFEAIIYSLRSMVDKDIPLNQVQFSALFFRSIPLPCVNLRVLSLNLCFETISGTGLLKSHRCQNSPREHPLAVRHGSRREYCLQSAVA